MIGRIWALLRRAKRVPRFDDEIAALAGVIRDVRLVRETPCAFRVATGVEAEGLAGSGAVESACDQLTAAGLARLTEIAVEPGVPSYRYVARWLASDDGTTLASVYRRASGAADVELHAFTADGSATTTWREYADAFPEPPSVRLQRLPAATGIASGVFAHRQLASSLPGERLRVTDGDQLVAALEREHATAARWCGEQPPDAMLEAYARYVLEDRFELLWPGIKAYFGTTVPEARLRRSPERPR